MGLIFEHKNEPRPVVAEKTLQTKEMSRTVFLFLTLLISVFSPGASVRCVSAQENRVLISDFQGKTTSGTLKEFGSEKIVLKISDSETLELATNEISVIVPDVLSQTRTTDESKSKIVQEADCVIVHLFDTTRIVATDLSTQDKNFVVSCVNGKKITIPVEQVEFLRFSVAPKDVFTQQTPEFSKILRTKVPDDRLVVSRDDSSLDYYSGVIRSVDVETVQFELDDEILPVGRNRVYGLIFHQSSPQESTAAICHLVEKNGSSWALREISYDFQEHLFRWKTVSKISARTPFSEWREISFAQENSVPLMQLTPIAVHSYLPAIWADGEVQGSLLSLQRLSEAIAEKSATPLSASDESPLLLRGTTPAPRSRGSRVGTKTEQRPLQIVQNVQLGGKTYTEGYALQAKTEMTFDLGGDYQTLHGFAGIDDRLRPMGNAKLLISGDGHLLFETTIRGDQPSRSLNVGVKDVKTLTITVDFPDGISGGTRLNLVEMLLVK